MTAVRGWLCSIRSCTSLLLTHWSQSAPTLLSDLHTTPCARPNCLWSDEQQRKRDKTTSVSRISKKKGQKCKTCNKWLTDASTDVDANAYSLGTRRKETDNPVLIFWIRKINQRSHSTQTGSANKTDPVGFHSLSSFNWLLKFKDYSINWNYLIKSWHQNRKKNNLANCTVSYIYLALAGDH